MSDIGKSTYSIKLGKPTTQPQQGGWEDVLPGVGGIVGALFQPEGLVPGAITSGIGGVLGETARQTIRATQGKGFDPMQILKTGGEQATYGMIPGVQEAKGLKLLPLAADRAMPIVAKYGLNAMPVVGKLAENIFGRTALRAGTGYLGGTAAGLISGEKPGQAQTQGGITGAINAISPVVGKTLGLLPKGVKYLGKTAVESAGKILERRSQPELAVIQQLFGKEAISTSEGKAFVNPFIKKIIDEYKIPIPPKGNISAFKLALDKASAVVEAKLQPILKDPIYSVQSTTPKSIIWDNLGQFFGRDTAKAARSMPVRIDKIFKNSIDKEGNISLSALKDIQREIGPVGGSDWSAPTADAMEKWARKTYTDLGKLIDDNLAKVDKAEYKDLIAQHRALINARDTFKGTIGSRGVLPVELTSETLAEEKAQSQGLAGGRWLELGARSLPLAIGAGAQFTGLPKEVKDVALLGSGLYGAAQFGPHLNPEQALKIGGAMENVPQVGQNFQRVLQQLGVRIPGLGQ